jgi:hypothetical protein
MISFIMLVSAKNQGYISEVDRFRSRNGGWKDIRYPKWNRAYDMEEYYQEEEELVEIESHYQEKEEEEEPEESGYQEKKEEEEEEPEEELEYGFYFCG